jgi:hypothetical protein
MASIRNSAEVLAVPPSAQSSRDNVRRHRETCGFVRVEVEVPPEAANDIRRLARLRRERGAEPGRNSASPFQASAVSTDAVPLFNGLPSEVQATLLKLMQVMTPRPAPEVISRFQRVAQNFTEFAARTNSLIS